MPSALITGITGQDGWYLAELLTAHGYDVFGLVRDPSSPKLRVVETLLPNVKLIDGDLTDLRSLISAVEIAAPDEVYNLGAISFVEFSWQQAELTGEVTGMGVLRMLEAVRIATGDQMSRVRFYQASSSEMFGKVPQAPQTEETPLRPRSPYGVAKTFGHNTVVTYRDSYGAFACSGIAYNHESPRRGPEYVTRKITRAVARIALGLQDTVSLGNLEARRDWGFAGDYVRAMWQMLQQDQPGDYVIATGKTWSIGDLLDRAFARIGVADWSELVKQDPRFIRPAEPETLVGDASKAKEDFGWEPKVGFHELVDMMVDSDLELEKAAAG
jgi:GDPmannose 4,6-dehydratase